MLPGASPKMLLGAFHACQQAPCVDPLAENLVLSGEVGSVAGGWDMTLKVWDAATGQETLGAALLRTGRFDEAAGRLRMASRSAGDAPAPEARLLLALADLSPTASAREPIGSSDNQKNSRQRRRRSLV